MIAQFTIGGLMPVAQIEGLDLGSLPPWLLIIILIFGVWYKDAIIDALRTFFGIKAQQVEALTETQARAIEFERTREVAQSTQIFETFSSIFDYLKQEQEKNRDERQKDREESAKQREQNDHLVKSIDRLINIVAHHTDTLRILTQQSAQVEDRLRDVEMELDRQFNGRRTERQDD